MRRSRCGFFARGASLTDSTAEDAGAGAEILMAGPGALTLGKEAESAATGGGALSPKVMQPPKFKKRRPMPPTRMNRGNASARNLFVIRPAFRSSIRASFDR